MNSSKIQTKFNVHLQKNPNFFRIFFVNVLILNVIEQHVDVYEEIHPRFHIEEIHRQSSSLFRCSISQNIKFVLFCKKKRTCSSLNSCSRIENFSEMFFK
jgi:hypothetical protein